MPLIATRGAASVQGFGEFAQSGPVNYIEDVFSTYLYAGNDTARTITNGVNLSNGGLVWFKGRNTGIDNYLVDSVRGGDKYLVSNSTAAQTTTSFITSFNNNGFGLSDVYGANGGGLNLASWAFAEKAKFFDVVTYTGDGNSGRTVSHNLGSTPGCIFVKITSGTGSWFVYHRSLGATKYLNLNSTGTGGTSSGIWNNTEPTSTVFTLGNDGSINSPGETYVAYLFAHDAGGFGNTGSDNVITCGSYTGSGGTTTPNQINLGYEAQWVLVKPSSGAGNWAIADMMRGSWIASDGSANFNELLPNTSGAENANNYGPAPTATGFAVSGVGFPNASGVTYIYIAIRRGPMKTPTVGTSVFYPQAISQADSIDSTNVPFPPDLINTFSRDGTNRTNKFSYFQFVDRLRGAGTPNDTRVAASEGLGLVSSGTDAEYGQANPPGFTYVQLKANSQDITRGTGWNSASYGNWINYFFRRAPGFFDEVCYTGTGSNSQSVTHNLGIAPEFIIVKSRSDATAWESLVPAAGTTKQQLYLNRTQAGTSVVSGHLGWNGTDNAYKAPTGTTVYFGSDSDVGGSGSTYVMYLFASVAGVSKVGSYTGTGTTLQVNCGFTNGSRFVLIKRTDSTGDWYVWDSARGIVAGDDPYLLLNSTAAEVTNTDYVDTYSAGFEISSTAPAAINANGGTFIFLAIA